MKDEHKELIQPILAIVMVFVLIGSFVSMGRHEAEKRESQKVYLDYNGTITDVEFISSGLLQRDKTTITLDNTTKLMVFDVQNGLVIGQNYSIIIEGNNLIKAERI